jgi:molybdopterin-guanine dinucleotide biosynthesis protein A
VNRVAVNVIVLAGQANRGALRAVSDAPNEALIPIGGKPMVQWVLDALHQAQKVGRILVVAPPGEVDPHVTGAKLEFVASRGNIVDNILAALALLPVHERTLIVSSDVPFITGQTIDNLIDLCQEREGDLYYPIVSRQVAEAQFPNMRRTYVSLREGEFTGGNIFLVNPDIADRVAADMKRFLEYRKKPFKMVALLGRLLGWRGWALVWRYLTKSIRIQDMENTISRMWRIRGVAVICPWPEVGADVDKPEDLELAQRYLLQ